MTMTPAAGDTLILAAPSKGRLKEQCEEAFAKAGLVMRKTGAERGYRGLIDGVDGIEVAYLSASEIAGALGQGAAHAGITGLDLVHEHVPSWATRVEPLLSLGFGQADVVAAVPQSWVDVTTVADLEPVALAFRRAHGRRPRVATKYLNLTRAFLAAQGVTGFLIVESLGATEGTPAAGTAEMIVDITTSGQTLRDNHLRILDDGILLKSTAHLVRSKTATWTPVAMAKLGEVQSRLTTAAPIQAVGKS